MNDILQGTGGGGEKWPAQSAPDQNYQTLPLMVILLVSEGAFSGGGGSHMQGNFRGRTNFYQE